MFILGIDTSCDDTSCAVVRDGRQVLSNIVSSQTKLHEKFGGVVPEIASRRHLEVLIPACSEALEQAGVTLKQIDLIAVTNGPCLLGSLLVGVGFAKRYGPRKVPLIDVHHIAGHIYASAREELLSSPCSTWWCGGHSETILMEPMGISPLGETRDDTAGKSTRLPGKWGSAFREVLIWTNWPGQVILARSLSPCRKSGFQI